MKIQPLLFTLPDGRKAMRPGISVIQQYQLGISRKALWEAAEKGETILVADEIAREYMEYLDVCDENGQPTGQVIERRQAHREGVRHRTAHVWIVRKQGERYQILMQKRAMGKDSFPGLYDTSSAGHIPAGNEPLESALRELKEELGIDAKAEDLLAMGHFDIQYEKIFYGRPFKDCEYVNAYLYTRPVDLQTLTLQASEVERVDWFDLEEVREEIRHNRERFCVPSQSLELLRDFLFTKGYMQ